MPHASAPPASAGLHRFLTPGTDREVAERYALLRAASLEQLSIDEGEFAFLDAETTGFDVDRDKVIEIAVLVARGPEVVERYSTLIDPGRPIPRETTQLTGIDDEAVAGAPRIETAIERVLEVLGERDVVAHNAAFDSAFVRETAGRIGRTVPGRWIDSLELSRIALPRLRSHRLRDLADAFDLPLPGHRAADDTEALFGIWRIALAGLADLPIDVLAEIVRLSPGTDWPLRETLARAAGRGRTRALDLKRLRTEAAGRAPTASALCDADDIDVSCPDPADVLGEFAAKGAVGRMYAGFEAREEQVRMAEAVLAAFGERRHLAVEAGTGVGKSVAYLLPAVRFAAANGIGVGIATKTNSLMDQLVHTELPRLDEALGGGLRYVALKGYEHYPCLRKIERLVSDEGGGQESLARSAALLSWIAQSSWGDLDSVNLHWGPWRQQVACSVEDCVRKRCRFYPSLCYLHGVRRRAGSASIVVTNHALLFRDASAAGGILPSLRYWIVDEAHSAESEARKQLSMTAEHRAIASLLSALHSEGRGGAIDALRAKVRTLAARGGEEEVAARAERLGTQLRGEISTAATIAGSFFEFLKDLPAEKSEYDTVEVHLTEAVRDSTEWSVAAGTGRSLVKHLAAITALGRDLLTAAEEAGDELADTRSDLAGYVSRLGEQALALETVLEGGDDHFVYSVHISRRPDDMRTSLSASMLDVGGALLERFFPDVHSAVFTSATIAAGDDFGHFARTLGLDRLPEKRWDSLRLSSSYDFDRQMAVFVPADMPEPAGGRHLGALTDLLKQLHIAMGGSVLTLFTSRREMEQVYDRLAEPLEEHGLRLLMQGRGMSTKRVRDEFLADERLSLLATKSFWEGFDAKGDTLRCVVIAKLPFGRMGDPLYAERRFRDSHAWDDYYLPEAVLELKQAAGRLIRSSTDEGCVIVADGRLAGERSYVSRFLRALPVSDVEVLPSAELVERVRERFGR